MSIFIGAENIVSPLGLHMAANFNAAKSGKIGGKYYAEPFPTVPEIFASRMPESFALEPEKVQKLTQLCAAGSIENIQPEKATGRWLIVLSTTKGDIFKLKQKDFEGVKPEHLLNTLQETLPFLADKKTISLACISGLAATIFAADQLTLKKYDHALVLGVDVVSEFTANGFQSFYALDPKASKPFDAHRKGLNLGEAAASAILSTNEHIFKEQPLKYLAGATSNDANHISGPSRTGEGLFRAAKRAMAMAKVEAKNIDYISAHGTGTQYNDDMESIAFNRLGLENTPLNSLKGYFGHTLGASSLVEIAMGLQSMRKNILLKNAGMQEAGTANPINVLVKNAETEVNFMLKTASGFGGCNAAAIFKK